MQAHGVGLRETQDRLNIKATLLARTSGLNSCA